jgi:DNA-binding CsgD family transcriptional regulator
MSHSRRVGASSLAYARGLAQLGELAELEDLGSFRAALPARMRGLVDCEIASYNEIGSGPEDLLVTADPVMPLDLGGMYEAFAALIMQNPLAAHFQRTCDDRALRMSDFISSRKLHQLDLYDLVYRHIATEYQLAFTVPVRGRLVGVTVNRAGRDFSDAELDLFEAAKHIALSAHRNLDDRARLEVILRGLDEIEDGPLAIVLIEANGSLSPAHGRAERLLSELSGEETATQVLRAWVSLQRRNGPLSVSEPLILTVAGGELLARYIHGSPGNLDAVAVRLPRVSEPQALRALGLTRRQAEVLHLLWRGCTNADIAQALSISEHTVRHHLENIYRQLGVSSRIAAAHVASRALSGAQLTTMSPISSIP